MLASLRSMIDSMISSIGCQLRSIIGAMIGAMIGSIGCQSRSMIGSMISYTVLAVSLGQRLAP